MSDFQRDMEELLYIHMDELDRKFEKIVREREGRIISAKKSSHGQGGALPHEKATPVHHTLTERDCAVIKATLEATKQHLMEIAPDRTLTARNIITTGQLEAELCSRNTAA